MCVHVVWGCDQVSVVISAEDILQGKLCVTVQRYLTHQFTGLGRLQDLWRDKRETKNVRDKWPYLNQCLLYLTRYKVSQRSWYKQNKVNMIYCLITRRSTLTQLLETLSAVESCRNWTQTSLTLMSLCPFNLFLSDDNCRSHYTVNYLHYNLIVILL